MRRRLFPLASCIFLLSACSPDVPAPSGDPLPRATPEDVGLSSEALDRLAGRVAGWVEEGDPVGAELLIVKEGRTVLHETWGWSDREQGRALGPNSIYRIRSMTKPFIGTAILMLAEEGRLSLDDRAADHLPSFDNERAASITIRQLLTHTSGLGDHGSEDIGLPKPLPEYLLLRELVDDIGEIGTTGTPGTFRYSDSGSATLGAIVAQVSGMPAERFLEERIFNPLGMEDTYTAFTPDAPWAAGMNSTYEYSADACGMVRYWDPGMEQQATFFRASGGVYSTAADYARFLAAWMGRGALGDVRLLNDTTVEAALQPEGDRGDGRRYGMQWTISNDALNDGLPAVFGHGGSDGTLAIGFPELDAVVLFLTQSRGSSARTRFRSELGRVAPFAGLVTDDWNPALEEEWTRIVGDDDPQDVAAARLGSLAPSPPPDTRYSGTYRGAATELVHEVSMRDGALWSTLRSEPDGSPLVPVSDGAFLKRHACRPLVARITFEFGADGGAVGHTLEASDGFVEAFRRER